MKMLSISKAKKLPWIKMSIEDMNNRLIEWGNPLRVNGFIEFYKIMECYCINCKQTFPRERKLLMYNIGCPVCYGQLVIKGYNDLATVRPELIQYFVNPEDASTVTQFAETKKLMKCPNCNYERLMLISNLAKRGFSCYCKQTQMGHCYQGLNDIPTIASWMLKYFLNPNDAVGVAPYSIKKKTVKCPNCLYVWTKKVADIYKNGLACPKCGDGISYPNKFGRAVLSQLPIINFIPEYSPTWAGLYKYDNYFEYQDSKYILEMDGAFHFIDTNITLSKDVKEKDIYKEKIANEHNINVIRIDARFSDFEYIKKQILLSELNNIFDLSIIDWNYCEEFSNRNILFEICKEYNNDTLLIKEFAIKYSISEATVRKYILRGARLGLCDISEDSHTRAGRIGRTRRKQLLNVA